MNYADGIYSDLLLVINTSYLSLPPASSIYVENYPFHFFLHIQHWNWMSRWEKLLEWSQWNIFCSQHNDGTQFKSVSYANLSVWEMEVFSFRIYTSRWDCLRKPKFTAKNLEPCQTYHRLEALGPSRHLLLLLAGGPSTGKHHNTGQHHNTG